MRGPMTSDWDLRVVLLLVVLVGAALGLAAAWITGSPG